MKCYLQCAEQQESASNFSKYCACHEKWLSWSILFTHETLFTMRGVTSVIVQTHQILRLPRKMNLTIDPCHTWKAIYNARSNKCHCPNSPNTAPATKNDCHDWSSSHMKRYLQCAEQQMASSNITEYILRLPRKLTLETFTKISRKRLKRHLQCGADPRMIRATSEQETVRRNPPRNRGDFPRSPRAFSMEKYNISRSGYHSKFHQLLRLRQFNITKSRKLA